MSLSDLALIGSFVSGVAVLISLIYLGAQVRQATKHQRAQMLESRTSRITDWNMRVAEPALAAVWNKALSDNHDFTAIEMRQLSSVVRTLFTIAEVAHFQHEEGLISAAAFESMRKNWAVTLSFPAGRVLWRLFRGRYDASFAAAMDELLAKTPLGHSLSVAEFNRAIAAEVAESRQTSGA
jgi:hypothetical protein